MRYILVHIFYFKNQNPIPMEKVIAVVVTYNRQALLSECITALRKQSRPLDAILVINNGSTDGTEDWLRQQPDIIFHYPKKYRIKRWF